MKSRIEFYKKFVSFFLSVMMIYSMGFTGIAVSAATTDVNNGDWSAENVTLQNTSEAQLMVRVGDIDNFGFGWSSNFDPFSGNDTPTHGYPFVPISNDIKYADGTDRIMVTSGYRNNTNNNGYYLSRNTSGYYNYNPNTTPNKETTDGYTKMTRPNGDKYSYSNYNSKYYIPYNGVDYYVDEKIAQADNAVRPIKMSFANELHNNNISVLNATLQLFVDDFQAGPTQPDSKKADHISQVKYQATINGVEIPELSDLINQLNQSGPIGKLITFKIPERYLDLIKTGSISIKIDDNITTNYSDGYAIDFAKLLINTKTFNNTATITGKVIDNNTKNPIAGATVSADEGVVQTITTQDGTYKLDNVPAGLAKITASKTGYTSQSYTKSIVGGGNGYTQDFQLIPITLPGLTLTPSTTTLTNQDVIIFAQGIGGTNPIKDIRLPDGTTVNGSSASYTAVDNGNYSFVVEDSMGNWAIKSIIINNIDKVKPQLILTQNPANVANGTVTIRAAATDNVAVSSITTPDEKIVQFNPTTQSNSTTYTVTANGTYTFSATDTAGNTFTQGININNIGNTNTNDVSLPSISASLESATPNPAKSSDEINVKYAINTVPFSLPSGMVDEAEVLVDMSQDMKNNQRFSEVQNGVVNQIINDSNLSGIKLGVVGYNDSVYIGTRSNYSEPKSCIMEETDENLSNINKNNFLPLYNLNDGNTKDGYRQFYQNGYISDKISNNDQRQFGRALKVADKVLTGYGTSGAKKAIIIVTSGNLTYSEDQIKNIIGKGYKIIVLDISNSDNTNIKDTYIQLCGNEFGFNGNYYKGTFNDNTNYNSVDSDMKNVDASLKGVTGVTALSINDAKLNIDLGENFKAVDGGGLQGTGRVCTATIPQINFTYNSLTGKWEQSGAVEVTFKVKSEIGKSGSLGFGLYTNSDNTTHTNRSTISYTDFYNIVTNKIIETPTINITKDTKVQSAPVITEPKDGTVTSDNTPTIIGTADANSTVKVYDRGTLIGIVTADGSGNWTLTPTTALSDGAHAITATSTDSVGNISPVSNTVNITIDSTAPLAPVITAPKDGTVTRDNTPTITGTAEANSTVKVYDGGTLIGTVTADGSGNWTFVPTTALVDGTHAITATATDAFGNVSPKSNVVNITIYIFEPSIMKQHGIYNGSGSSIISGNNVTNEMPVTMAMIVYAMSSNPAINLGIDYNTKITIDKTSFKGYEISEDGKISGKTALNIDDSGNITGLSMQNGKRYLIVYTITPVGTGNVTLTATADTTSSKSVELNVGEQPDLF